MTDTVRSLSRIVLRAGAAALAVAVALGPVAGSAFARTPNETAPATFADLAEQLLPAVVNISTTQEVTGRGPDVPQFPPGSPFEEFFRDFFDRQGQNPQAPRRAASLGSGFVVDAENGYVVTNNHVIAEADEIRVVLQDDTSIKAELVGRDPKTDLAVLKLEMSPEVKKKLKAVSWGDSDIMRVGDWVVAIGNPFGLGGTVTAGIISARARNINAGPYDDFLQTDASINRGNSGGPMFNLKGEVIGINTAIFSPSGGSVGIGFAIPTSLAKPVVEQLIKYKRTRRGWLGVRIQTVDEELAEALKLKDPSGALIASVSPGGPAEVAGIKSGDIVIEFDGKPVPDMRRLPRMVADTEVEAEVPIVVWRDGQRVPLKVKVGELEAAEESGQVAALTPDKGKGGKGLTRAVKELGLSLAPLSDETRKKFEVAPAVKGIVVTDVDQGSAAAEQGLAAGDVIVEANQEAVENPADLQRKTKEARDAGKKSVLLLIDRKGDLRFVALSLDGKG